MLASVSYSMSDVVGHRSTIGINAAKLLLCKQYDTHWVLHERDIFIRSSVTILLVGGVSLFIAVSCFESGVTSVHGGVVKEPL